MSNLRTASATLGILVFSLALSHGSFAATRADCERIIQPESGQPGKDVVWVPTHDLLVTRMLTMAGVGKSDLVYDLGAGDGKIAIAAAKQFGARAVGVEYNPDMARLGQCLAEVEGVANRVRIVQGDIFETDFSEATVVTLYLLPDLNLKLRPTILKMKPGTRVVSHSFTMDDWRPDEQTEDGSAYFWVVPADVNGTWNFRSQNGDDRFTIRMKQLYQDVSGQSGGNQPLREARLRGDQISFAFEHAGAPVKVSGRVAGNRIEATVTRGAASTMYIGTRS
jgi:SAM-dependent methyltransferase